MPRVVDADTQPGRLQTTTVSIHEERRLAGVREPRACVGEIVIERGHGRRADRHDPILPAFARPDEEHPIPQIEVGEVGADDFAEPEARAVERLEDRAVAHADRIVQVWRGYEPMRLGNREHPAWQRSDLRDGEDVRRIPQHDLTARQEGEEAARDAERDRARRRREPLTATGRPPRERPRVGRQVRLGDPAGTLHAAGVQILHESGAVDLHLLERGRRVVPHAQVLDVARQPRAEVSGRADGHA